MKNQSYFAFSNNINPLHFLDRKLNPFCHLQAVVLDQQTLAVSWTRRAEQAIAKLAQPLGIEMQLYFSCMVKKRVIFSDKSSAGYSMMTEKIGIMFNCVQSNSCDPEEFAAHYPEKKILNTRASLKMHPKELFIDYKKNEWVGEFTI